MPYLRLSHARYMYECAFCGTYIHKGHAYFRDEPHPFARLRGKAVSHKVCIRCVLGDSDADIFLDALVGRSSLPLGFQLTNNGFLRFPPQVEVCNISPQLIQILAESPDRIRELTPDKFEVLICNRLDAIGLNVQRPGAKAFHKDGGIDILAWPRSPTIPCLIAVQVKHTRSLARKIGPQPVRDLAGVVSSQSLNAGLLVTNTTFTPDAEWVAKQRPFLIQLKDIGDLARWLRNDFLSEAEWRRLPREVEVCPGLRIVLRE